MIGGIHHVQLAMPPGGEEEAVRFYGEVLGREVVPKPKRLAGRGRRWTAAEGVQVRLGVEPRFAPAREAHPAFLVRDLDAVRRRFETAGVGVESHQEVTA